MGFVDGAGDDGVDLSRKGQPRGFLQGGDSSAGRLWRGRSWNGPLGLAKNAVMKSRVELAGCERCVDHFRADARSITQGDSNCS